MSSPSIAIVDVGQMPYDQTWELQEKLVLARAAGNWTEDTLLLVEHPHVFTLGRRTDASHLLDPRDDQGTPIPTFEVNRGGDITYHGPGQIVGYPILSLAGVGGDVIVYLRTLEDILIRVCQKWGIPAERKKAYTGVWVEGKKIASIGVGVQRGYTLHGFALNVNTDMSYFDRIVPCGIQGVEMTSLERLSQRPVDMKSVKREILQETGLAFHRTPRGCRLADLPVA